MASPTPAPTTPISQAQAQAHQTPSHPDSHSRSHSHAQEKNNNSNNDNASPQSPPLPPPSLTSAGPRATALNRIFSEALTHSLRTCTYANFAACFPTPAACEPDALRELWRMFGGELEERCRVSYDAILTSRNVIPSLNELDRLIADARKRKDGHHQNSSNNNISNSNSNSQANTNTNPTPPHTLPPHTLYTAHLRPFLRAQNTSLTERAAAIHERNEGLASRIREQRDEMEVLVARLEGVVGDLEGAAGLMMGGGSVDGADGLEGAGETGKMGEAGGSRVIGRDEIRGLEGW